jgi:hypothetical protein
LPLEISNMRKNKLNIRVVGISHLGNYHLQKYSKLENCEIVAVADTLSYRAKKAAAYCAAIDKKDIISAYVS